MTTIQVTGGYADFAVCEVVERDGLDLSTAEFKATLLALDANAPASDAGVWRSCTVEFPRPGLARVSLLVDSDQAPGDYHLWVSIEDTPTFSVVEASNMTIHVI